MGDYLNDLRRLVNTIVSMSRNKIGPGFSILGCYLSDFIKKTNFFKDPLKIPSVDLD